MSSKKRKTIFLLTLSFKQPLMGTKEMVGEQKVNCTQLYHSLWVCYFHDYSI